MVFYFSSHLSFIHIFPDYFIKFLLLKPLNFLIHQFQFQLFHVYDPNLVKVLRGFLFIIYIFFSFVYDSRQGRTFLWNPLTSALRRSK